jgi:hypothetical protein
MQPGSAQFRQQALPIGSDHQKRGEVRHSGSWMGLGVQEVPALDYLMLGRMQFLRHGPVSARKLERGDTQGTASMLGKQQGQPRSKCS